MSLTSYLDLIESQRGELDALSFDVDPYFALDEQSRTAALERLMQLARDGDARAVATLGRIGDARAVPVLEHAVLSGRAGSGLGAEQLGKSALRALFQVRTSPADEAEVATMLGSDLDLDRALAAAAVKEAVVAPLGNDARHAAARRLLPKALGDPAVATRHHAGRAVVALLGLDAETLPRQHPLAVMLFALSTSLDALWRPAARELEKRLICGARAPSYEPSVDPGLGQRFWDALRPPSPAPAGWSPFSLALVADMSVDDRAWVETLLVARLALGDAHAPNAALSLLGERVRPYLEEAMKNHAARAAFVAACKQALASLDAPA